MPEYLFESRTGEQRRHFFSMSDAPSIGTDVQIDGEHYTRLPETDVQVDVGAIRYKYPYVSQSLPKNLSGCETNKQGKPIIKSRAHEANVAAEHGYVRDY